MEDHEMPAQHLFKEENIKRGEFCKQIFDKNRTWNKRKYKIKRVLHAATNFIKIKEDVMAIRRLTKWLKD